MNITYKTFVGLSTNSDALLRAESDCGFVLQTMYKDNWFGSWNLKRAKKKLKRDLYKLKFKWESFERSTSEMEELSEQRSIKIKNILKNER
jgi:hypothetical protein